MNAVKSKSLIFIGILIVVIASVFFLYYYSKLSESNLRQDVYSEFTCTCCEDSILTTPYSCFMAGGMREYVNKIVKGTKDKEEVMLESVKKFGIPTLIDLALKEKYGFMFVDNPPKDAPSINIRPNFVDLGEVSNSKGIIITDFRIKNNGTQDLIITDLKTSCACLHASFIKDGDESVRTGRFSHSEGWTFILEPNEDALLRTYYDPRVTNWQTGHVERIVTITSNDPIYFERIIKLAAELVP